MREAVRCAAIISGGASRRMRQDKALMPIEGEPMIARVAKVLRPLFETIIVVTSNSEIAQAANLSAVPDAIAGKGPLGGIHAALKHFQQPTFCVACDLPYLSGDVIQLLCSRFDAQCDVVAPHIHERMETLHAIYAPSCLPVLEHAFESETMPGAQRVLSPLRLCFLTEGEFQPFDADLKFFTNLNTPEEAQRAGIGLRPNSV